MGDLSKSVRLHRLVQLLSVGKHYLTASELAQLLHVTERTIYRDFIDLDQLGYSVYNDRGYKFHNPANRQNLPITLGDISVLTKVIDASPLNRLPYMKERIDVILAKINASLCTDLDPPVLLHSSIESLDPTPSSPFTIDVGKLEKAINKERVISILYYSLDEPMPSIRLVHPYVITIRFGYWYLIAFTPEKNDFRQYRLERIQSLTVCKETFQRDPSFNLQDYFCLSLGVFQGEPVRVKVRLQGKAARLASERPWPENRVLEWTTDDTLFLQVTVQGTQEIVAWVLSLGEEAEILEPLSLREQMYKTLREMLGIYK